MAEQEWKISKASPACVQCAQQFSPGTVYYSALLQTPESLERKDYCEKCYGANRPENVYYFWKRTQPDPQNEDTRRTPVIDIDYVMDFFKRLEGENAQQKLAFRYILALMLTRKKLLISEGRKSGVGGQSICLFREKRGGQVHSVLEPDLNEDEVKSVSTELGVLLGLTPPPAPAAEGQIAAAAGDANVPVKAE